MNPKNIDRLFQEKLKNLEAKPNKKVWNAIEGKLTQKKRRILPMWWFSGGIAATLILGLLLFPFSKDKNGNENNSIITETSDKDLEINTNLQKNIDSVLFKEKLEIKVAEEKTDIKFQNNNPNTKNFKSREKTIVAKKKTNNTESIPLKKATQKVFLAENTANNKLEKHKKEVLGKTKILKENPDFKNTDRTNFKNEKEGLKNKKQQDIIDEKIIIKETIKPKKDFLTAIKTSEEIKKTVKNKTKNTWSLSPVVAILNSNSFSDTSPINSELSSSTTGKNTFSFGLQVGYKINNKWSVQSGIHQQKMSYQNSNIIVTNALTNSKSSTVFNDQNSFNYSSTNNTEAFRASSDISLTNKISSNGNLTQEYGYIEVPLEIKYNLSTNKKFDSQIVAGFSSLFLNTNTVELDTNSFTESGNVDNLNSINFSGNLGLDFNYYLNKSWSVNINPMFKAQLNTFNEKANGFSPFNIGVYSGIKYNF